ncbi:MAG: T9SS type A sorting domain-containing protein [Bacteroidetes bacterium]|nr:T9SS type A sorting domain-containing protein [Bacteroidota bacterium]
MLEINNAENSEANISIKNPLGTSLQNFQIPQSKISLNLHKLSKGIYFIEALIDNNKITKKLIIN